MYYKILFINEVTQAVFLCIGLILWLMIQPILMMSCLDGHCYMETDSSEENNLAESCIPEMGKFLCRNNITCLTLDKACDGTVDCPDRTDESVRCTASSNCNNMTCPPASKCQMMPQTGPECICPKGFKHSLLEDVCADVDECLEQYGICSQTCINIPGTYRCTCDDGYRLKEDDRTCEAHGEEALLLYTTQDSVIGVNLRSKSVRTIAQNLTKVIGVCYNGEHIYWTNIQIEIGESIVKANPDGTQQEILLTSGIDAPEDIAVDWLTGNIYFSDNAMHHIAVCSNDGRYCAVLVTDDVHQPRGVALWPQRGQIFWSDWGINPMIARASMDGSNSMRLVTENIHWPNGVALDMYNDRLYWVDAKMATIESVLSDGTDRKIVLDKILKHPYGLAVFEDNIYWSDWATKSINSCNKFTGKDHKIITKDRTIYAVYIYHSSKQKKVAHACERSLCSHLCLLGENNTFSCSCPYGMQLASDHLHCMTTHKKQRLFLGVPGNLLEMEHTTFGRHTISTTHKLDMFIHELAYNSVNNTVFVADNFLQVINEANLENNIITTVVRGNLGNITGLAFDHLSYNLYWSDSERQVVEVYSLQAKHRAIVSFYSGLEIPIGLAVIPDYGIMFIALKSRRNVHIDQKSLSGQEEHSHVFEDELGHDDIKFATDFETNTLYWADSDLGRISFSDYRNLQANTFRDRLERPYSIAIVDEDLFWTELRSNTIHWNHKSNMGPLKRFDIEVNREMYSTYSLPSRTPLLASTPAMIVDHPCQHWNGGCSHVCVTLGKFTAGCLCPAGLVFKDATNRTCIEALDCEFRCSSGECLTLSRKCNGRKDCPDGSDEYGCDKSNSQNPKVVCPVGKFMCHNAEQCLDSDQRCDSKKQCNDGSDEDHCDNFDKSKNCHRHQHVCNNGNCVDFSVMCDGVNDCGDNSDEENCKLARGKDAGMRPVCTENMFQCNSGTCIAKNWECDGKIDCPDGSDERDKCGPKECPDDMHKCNGQCIDKRLLCDGHNDCGDMSDELNCDMATGEKRKMSCGDENNPMYECASDTNICLEISAKCNGTAECPRGEDEADCGNICSIYEFRCKVSKECIRMEFRCDHEKDCADGSDEENCERIGSWNGTFHTHEKACGPKMYDCGDGKCVDETRICDGFEDCDTGADEGPLYKTACKPMTGAKQSHDGSDEDNCDHFDKSKNCHCHQHVCNNGNCVDFSVMCDGVNDCGDNSDEENCKLARGKDAGLRPVCTENMFQCNSGTCIVKNWECNDKIDCPDGSDEHDKCELKKCGAGMHKCHLGQCIDNRLVCDGYNDCGDMSDEQNCEITCGDEKNPLYECPSNTTICLDHSAKCNGIAECPQGEDEVGCDIKRERLLFFSTYDEVRSMTMQSPFILKVMWKTNGTKVSGFDLNVRNRKAYFTTDHANILYMIDVNKEKVEGTLEIPMPGKAALDWITDNVYVISRSQVNEIQVCSFSVKMCATIIKVQPEEIIKTLAVDAYNRRLFYVIVQIQNLGLHSSQIATTSLDGTNLEYILSRDGSLINTLACDPYKEMLYYTDVQQKTLQAINYRTGSNQNPITIIQKRNVIINPAGLTWYENQIFIINFGAKDVIKCQLNGTKSCESINLNNLNAEDVLIDDEYRQPMNRNPCAIATCQYMCILSEFSYKCICGNSSENETKYCDLKNAITLTKLLSQNQSTTDKISPHFAAIIWLLFIFLALVVGYIGYFYCHRNQQGRWHVIYNTYNPLTAIFQQQQQQQQGSKTGTLDSRLSSVDTESSRNYTAPSFEVKEEKVHIGL